MTTLDHLADEKYVLLTTFRRDGRAVPTPVWAVLDERTLAVWTVADSGKVKRVRRNGSVTVAPCDVRGNPKGPAVPGRATVTDAAGTEHVRRLLARKYGLVGRLSIVVSRLRRGRDGTVGILIVAPG